MRSALSCDVRGVIRGLPFVSDIVTLGTFYVCQLYLKVWLE